MYCAYVFHSINCLGPPPTPEQLFFTVLGKDSLRVDWFSPIIERVRLCFNVVLTSNSLSMHKRICDKQNYNFTVENRMSCDIFRVQVTAANDAGTSNNANITGSFPLLPEEQNHSLAKIEGTVLLNVTFIVR